MKKQLSFLKRSAPLKRKPQCYIRVTGNYPEGHKLSLLEVQSSEDPNVYEGRVPKLKGFPDPPWQLSGKCFLWISAQTLTSVFQGPRLHLKVFSKMIGITELTTAWENSRSQAIHDRSEFLQKLLRGHCVKLVPKWQWRPQDIGDGKAVSLLLRKVVLRLGALLREGQDAELKGWNYLNPLETS